MVLRTRTTLVRAHGRSGLAGVPAYWVGHNIFCSARAVNAIQRVLREIAPFATARAPLCSLLRPHPLNTRLQVTRGRQVRPVFLAKRFVRGCGRPWTQRGGEHHRLRTILG